MAGTAGAKCPACGAVSNPAPEKPAKREPSNAVPEQVRDIFREALAQAPGERPRAATQMQKAALGLTLFMWAAAAFLVSIFATMGSAELGTLISFAAFVLGLAAMLLMGQGLGFQGIGLLFAVVAVFIPVVNIIALLVVASRAMQALKAAGYRIGFMGAKRPAS